MNLVNDWVQEMCASALLFELFDANIIFVHTRSLQSYGKYPFVGFNWNLRVETRHN